jgi:hypothetical protein
MGRKWVAVGVRRVMRKVHNKPYAIFNIAARAVFPWVRGLFGLEILVFGLSSGL